MEATDLNNLTIGEMTNRELEDAIVAIARERRRREPAPTAWETTLLLRRVEAALLRA